MEANTTKIKRLAQFIFDNAEMIETELSKSSHYRSFSITLDMFKHDRPEPRLGLELSLYDSTTTHYKLIDDAICIERLKQLCEQINNESGVNPPPKPARVRKALI